MARREIRRSIIGLVAAAIAVPGVAYRDVHRRADATFERHARDLTARTAALQALPPLEPPRVFGERLPGNGWDLFARALNGFDALPTGLVRWIDQAPYYGTQADPDDGDVERLLALAAGPIDDLRRSFRHAELRPVLEGAQVCAPRLELWGAFQASDVIDIALDHAHERGDDRLAGDVLLLGLGLAQAVGRYGTPEFRTLTPVWEYRFLQGWESVLASQALAPAHLASLSRSLEAVWAARADPLDAAQSQDLLFRRSLVLGLPAPQGSTRDELSWRSLYSERLRDAQALNRHEQCREELNALRPLPVRQRAVCILERLKSGQVRSAGHVGYSLVLEALVATRWTLARVATALAWFEADCGALPADLRELLPRYLSELPTCPLTGIALGYRSGRVWCHGPDVFEEGGLAKPSPSATAGAPIAWTVARKK